MEQNSIHKNLRSAKYFIAGANFIASIFFFITYMLVDDILVLVATIALFLTSIAVLIYFSRLEKKVDKRIKEVQSKQDQNG